MRGIEYQQLAMRTNVQEDLEKRYILMVWIMAEYLTPV